MTTRVAGAYATWAVLAIGLLLGCGDSAANDDSGEEPPECLSPGAIVMCVCETTMVQGIKSCQDDGTFSDCRCRPPGSTDPNNCIEGSKWMCPPCAGQSEGELVECPADHMIVCCGGSDGGGTIPTPLDAGQDASPAQDAGQDAATGSDAG